MARSLLETIRSVGDNEEDANTVLKAMVKLAQDPGEASYSVKCTEISNDKGLSASVTPEPAVVQITLCNMTWCYLP